MESITPKPEVSQIISPNYFSIFVSFLIKGGFVILVLIGGFIYLNTLDFDFIDEVLENIAETGIEVDIDFLDIINKVTLYGIIATVLYILLSFINAKGLYYEVFSDRIRFYRTDLMILKSSKEYHFNELNRAWFSKVGIVGSMFKTGYISLEILGRKKPLVMIEISNPKDITDMIQKKIMELRFNKDMMTSRINNVFVQNNY